MEKYSTSQFGTCIPLKDRREKYYKKYHINHSGKKLPVGIQVPNLIQKSSESEKIIDKDPVKTARVYEKSVSNIVFGELYPLPIHRDSKTPVYSQRLRNSLTKNSSREYSEPCFSSKNYESWKYLGDSVNGFGCYSTRREVKEEIVAPVRRFHQTPKAPSPSPR